MSKPLRSSLLVVRERMERAAKTFRQYEEEHNKKTAAAESVPAPHAANVDASRIKAWRNRKEAEDLEGAITILDIEIKGLP